MNDASPDLGKKLRTVLVTGVFAGLLAVLMAAPAEANRGTKPDYVPPASSDNTPVTVPLDLQEEDPQTDPSGTGVEVSPGTEDSSPVPAGDDQATDPAQDETSGEAPAEPVERARGGGILSKTGVESMSLARVGLAAVALGIGFVLMGRRRRAAGTVA